MIVATHAKTLPYKKAKEVNELLRSFANKVLSQQDLEKKLKKIGCNQVYKFYKE